MGEAKQETLAGLKFNRAVRVEARPERLSDSGGAVLVREALERSGLLQALSSAIEDPRDSRRITHPQKELLATFVTMLALGWRDQDDADALRKDPLLRLAVSERTGDAPLRDDPEFTKTHNPPEPQGLASQPTLSRLLHRLGERERLDALRGGLRECAERRLLALNGGQKAAHITLDVDGLPISVEGLQPGSAYNGYVHDTIFYPLVTTSAELGDMIAVRLREGNAGAAAGACEAIREDVQWARAHLAHSVSVRIDAGMPSEELLRMMEEDRVRYVARLKNNAVLDRLAAPYLKRPSGRRPSTVRTWIHECKYQAGTWSRSRRVVLVVVDEPDELLLRHFWIVTNWRADRVPGEQVLERYRRRGTAEGHLGEFKDVIGLKLSSAPRGQRSEDWRSQIIGPVRPCDDPFFHANDALLQLCAIAYNAMHMLRRVLYLALPVEEHGWSLRRVRERILRVAARVSLHARRVIVVVTQASARYWSLIWEHWNALDDPLPHGR
jgi:hypothetical protein